MSFSMEGRNGGQSGGANGGARVRGGVGCVLAAGALACTVSSGVEVRFPRAHVTRDHQPPPLRHVQPPILRRLPVGAAIPADNHHLLAPPRPSAQAYQRDSYLRRNTESRILSAFALNWRCTCR